LDDADLAASISAFQAAAARLVQDLGGLILGSDDFVVLAGFGTPLHAAAEKKGRRRDAANPEPEAPAQASLGPAVSQAFSAALAIAESEPAASHDWRLGLDAGRCAFYASALQGYAAQGRPLRYARILSGQASRYDCRVLATEDAVAAAGDAWLTRRRDRLVEKWSGEEKAFYELIGRRPS
jgi:hypothetical protein